MAWRGQGRRFPFVLYLPWAPYWAAFLHGRLFDDSEGLAGLVGMVMRPTDSDQGRGKRVLAAPTAT